MGITISFYWNASLMIQAKRLQPFQNESCQLADRSWSPRGALWSDHDNWLIRRSIARFEAAKTLYGAILGAKNEGMLTGRSRSTGHLLPAIGFSVKDRG
jgi:hypothetical protein